jgi:hypothetical protein
MAKKEELVDLLDSAAVQTLSSVFKFLIECAQGPCLKNQEALIRSELAECCKSIFTSNFRRLHDELGAARGRRGMEQIQAIAMKALMSLMEGSHLHADHGRASGKHLQNKLETSLLRQRLIKSHQKILEISQTAVSGSSRRTKSKEAIEREKRREEHVLGEARDMITLVDKLSEVSSSLEEEMTPLWQKVAHTDGARDGGVGSEQQLNDKAKREQEEYSDAHFFFFHKLKHVEIVWKGHLERLLFVEPRLCATHTQYDREQCIDQLDFSSATGFSDFVNMTTKKKRELEQNFELENSSWLFKFVAQYFHLFKDVTYLLAVIINIALVLSVSFPDGEQNAWIHDEEGERRWNHQSARLNETVDPIYGQPYYGTDEGEFGADGQYSGPKTLVRGSDLMHDSGTLQRATVYVWKSGALDGETVILIMGIMHLLFQICGLCYRIICCRLIVCEDMEKLSTCQAGYPGGVTSDGTGRGMSASYSSRSRRSTFRGGELNPKALAWEEFRGVRATATFSLFLLLQLAGRYGRVPAPFLWVNVLLVPSVMKSLNQLLLKWQPWTIYR